MSSSTRSWSPGRCRRGTARRHGAEQYRRATPAVLGAAPGLKRDGRAPRRKWCAARSLARRPADSREAVELRAFPAADGSGRQNSSGDRARGARPEPWTSQADEAAAATGGVLRNTRARRARRSRDGVLVRSATTLDHRQPFSLALPRRSSDYEASAGQAALEPPRSRRQPTPRAHSGPARHRRSKDFHSLPATYRIHASTRHHASSTSTAKFPEPRGSARSLFRIAQQ